MPKIKDLTFNEAKKRTNFLDLISPNIHHTNSPSTSNKNKTATKDKKTDNKVATNWQQTDNKTDNKVATNWQQTGNKNKRQTKNWQQSGNTTGNRTGDKLATNWQQTDNKPATPITFSQLVGLQRKTIIFIYHECKNLRTKITNPITLEHIAKSLKHSNGAIKTTLQRLEKKSFIRRPIFKNGRGGWSRYELPDDVYQEVLRNESDNKLATNWQQTGNKLASQPATELATTIPSSSSYINIKTTTTGDAEEWGFESQDYKSFGFMDSHRKQLISLGSLSASEVEQSLIEFNHDLKNKFLPPIRTSNVNFLMGLFRSGKTYISENFRTEQQAAIAEMSRRAKVKQQKLQEEEFLAWESALTEEEKSKIQNLLPTQLMVSSKISGLADAEVKAWWFSYFLENKSKLLSKV